MSCNGCRVLRKGCSENCVLRTCLQWINNPEAQGHATVFVAKFFGRVGLMSFISSVPEAQRPALFQSLLFEACGRTVNPVHGAVGLLSTGTWNLCQAAVQTVLRGGALQPVPEFINETTSPNPPTVDPDEADVSCASMFKPHQRQEPNPIRQPKTPKRRRADEASENQLPHLHLILNPQTAPSGGRGPPDLDLSGMERRRRKRQVTPPSMNSSESVMTTMCLEGRGGEGEDPRLLNLFD